MSTKGCRLYLVTPQHLADNFQDDLAAALDAGDVACVQLRVKDQPDATVLKLAERLRPIAQSRGVAFLLNDRPDLALKAGCDGAHVGQTDAPAEKARKLLGDLTLGVTCHNSRHLAMQAGEAGADYVAFGAFYASRTKTPPEMAEPGILRWWSQMMEIPSVAIGGITAKNCAPLVEAGADFLAVSAAIWQDQAGPAVAVRALRAAMAAAG